MTTKRTVKQLKDKAPSREAIRRAVASSTAIETGKPIALIENQLRASGSRRHTLKLAR